MPRLSVVPAFGAGRDVSSPNGKHVRLRFQQALHVFSQVLDQLIAISHLGGMRQRSVHRVGIGAGPISADYVNFSMAFEPGKNSLSGAIGQEIDWPARLEVDQNGSIAVPTPHGEIISSQHADRGIIRGRDRT